MIKIQRHQRKHQIHLKTRLSRYLVLGILFLAILLPASYIYAALSCSVTTQAACTGGDVTILRMSGSTNGHAELPSQSNTNYNNNVVCCSSGSSIGNSCSGNFKSVVRISGSTNGTTQESNVNTYGTNVCLSSTTPGDEITIGYQNTNCSGFDTTLLSLSSSDNAHVGDGSAYNRKVCGTLVPQTLTFDVDTASDFHNGESSAPYTVPLGTLTTGSVTHSDNSSIRMIVAEGDTSASGGMVVTVRNTNGANGLVSVGTPADKIPSATATMAAGTANYGLCAASAGLVGFTRATSYNTTCALASGTNAVVGLTTTPTDILNSAGAPVVNGHAEIVVNGAISTATPAHPDYKDTLTFIATGTF